MDDESLREDVKTGYELAAFKESKVGRFLLAKAVGEIKDALSALADADPTDFKKIVELQSRVKVARGFREWIDEGIMLAAQAEEILESNLESDGFEGSALEE